MGEIMYVGSDEGGFNRLARHLGGHVGDSVDFYTSVDQAREGLEKGDYDVAVRDESVDLMRILSVITVFLL